LANGRGSGNKNDSIGGVTMKTDPYTGKKLFEIGDWVTYEGKNTNFIAFIMGLELGFAKVYIVSSTNEKSTIINTLQKIQYNELDYIPQAELSEEQLIQAVDLSLDIKDKAMFLAFSTELLLLQNKNKVKS
jgi:hypothetical protein